jgi:hypothetical protein
MRFWEYKSLDVQLEIVSFAIGYAQLFKTFSFLVYIVQFQKLLQVKQDIRLGFG